MLVVVVVIIARALFDARAYLLLDAFPLARGVLRSISACVLYSCSSNCQTVIRSCKLPSLGICAPIESLDSLRLASDVPCLVCVTDSNAATEQLGYIGLRSSVVKKDSSSSISLSLYGVTPKVQDR